ncbi:MAG: cation transporter dimerization domain-containing protein, partial [Paraburkholderia nemoris]
RKMGDFALVDAHILVDPLISVSEGHYIAESARLRVLTDSRVLDALIHVDPENDALARPPFDLPTRERVIAEVNAALASHGVKAAAVNIHYLSTGLDVEVVLPDALSSRVLDGETQRLGRVDLAALKARLGARRVELLQALDVASAAQADPETLGAKGGVAIEERTKATEPHSAT